MGTEEAGEPILPEMDGQKRWGMESRPCQGQLLGALVLESGVPTAVESGAGGLTSLKLRGFAFMKTKNDGTCYADVFGNSRHYVWTVLNTVLYTSTGLTEVATSAIYYHRFTC